MKLRFEEWPETGDVTELWLTKLEGEGVITQACFAFSRADAEEKAAVFNNESPGIASVVGPFSIQGANAR